MSCPYAATLASHRPVSALQRQEGSPLGEESISGEPRLIKTEKHRVLRRLIGAFFEFVQRDSAPLYVEPVSVDLWERQAEAFCCAWQSRIFAQHDRFIAEIGKRPHDDPTRIDLERLIRLQKIDGGVILGPAIRGGLDTFTKYLTTIAAHLPHWIADAKIQGESVVEGEVYQSVSRLAFALMAFHIEDLREFSARASGNPSESSPEEGNIFVRHFFRLVKGSLDLTPEAAEEITAALKDARTHFSHLYLDKAFGCPAAYPVNEGGGRMIRTQIALFFSDFEQHLGARMRQEIERRLAH